MLWEEQEGRERQEGQPEGGEEQGQEERREWACERTRGRAL